ncbi:nuclear ubiquitous casein and cyclin-dependent kinase substrate 1 isoform X1 [Petaurus breviceps papuanus]|uniref:nuclear ubiquitous casein and cyclin-dependent kinase substrate 1 isoform X1 n=1 Tax=Petaurus breviceps papuanus TaxID=3040969 RepID=UPI0036DBB7FA
MGSRDYLFKVLVVGDAAVGKTSLVQRYCQDTFSKHYKSTVGVDFALKVVQWSNSEMVRLQLWDIAGQERFTSMTRLYYRDASACVIMFDVTNATTFSNSQRWKQDLDCKLTLPSGEPVPCLLLANKSDLSPWAVTRDQIDRFSKENGFTGWTETSVKENKNVNEAMRNRKVVDYSQFQESDDADEDYGRDSAPPAKKIRSSPREAKNKRRSGKNSQEDSEDSEEKDVKTKKDDSHSPEDSEDEKEDHKNVRQQRQAASKAASKQREMLMEDVGSEEEQEEEEEAPFQEKDSGSDEDFLMEDDDDSDYGSSKKKNKKIVKKSKPERKEKKMPKPRLKATVTPSPVKGKGKVGRPTASKASKEKTPSPKEEDEEPESPPEKKKSASPPPEKSGDEGSEDEAQSGED